MSKPRSTGIMPKTLTELMMVTRTVEKLSRLLLVGNPSRWFKLADKPNLSHKRRELLSKSLKRLKRFLNLRRHHSSRHLSLSKNYQMKRRSFKSQSLLELSWKEAQAPLEVYSGRKLSTHLRRSQRRPKWSLHLSSNPQSMMKRIRWMNSNY